MLAKQSPQMAFISLNHYLDLEWLREAFHRTRKDGAPGVDGQTWTDYAVNLEENLQSLLDRAKSGTYRAPPVRRVHIPKGTGKETRPIGIPTLEDKVLQRSVVMILEAIYEQDFYDCSYGFRPGRSAHQALESLWTQTMKTGGGWILEVDVRKFFDTLDHGHLRAFLKQRVRDGMLLRLIGKWLNAGVLEDGCLTYPEAGSPQGGVISPILANAFLHYVLDEWFVRDVKPGMKGKCFLIRFADDFLMCCQVKSDAERLMEVLPKRFKRFKLSLHPKKTKLIPFGKPPSSGKGQETFDFLGFTFYWGRTLKGYWVIKKKTARKRLKRFLRMMWVWCKANRHDPMKKQHEILCSKLRGFYQYFGVRGNYKVLEVAYEYAEKAWQRWLSRRSSKGYVLFEELRKSHPLPKPRIVHNNI